MLFSEVVGQADLKQKMITLIQAGKLPHAILLLGQEGSGGLPLARAMSQYIMCKNRDGNDSCNTCSSCVKMNKMQHPDVHFSFPTYKKEKTKAPVSNDFIKEFREHILQFPYSNDIEWLDVAGAEKQGNITSLECKEIIQKLQMRSFESEYKILIMWYPEYLGNEGNILLKLIEEPTAKTILIFVSSNADEVIQTIQSRTQLFPLKRITDMEIKKALMDQHVSEEKSTQVARLAEGNYHVALQLLTQVEDDMLTRLRTWLNCIYANQGIELVSWTLAMAELNKELQKKFLEYTLQILEHLIRVKRLGSNNLSLLESEQKIIDVLISKGLSEYAIQDISKLLNDAIYQIERNANTKILFHALSLRVQQLIHRKNVSLAMSS